MKELPSAYIARDVEKKWPEIWDRSGVFHANPMSDKPPFCVMMPPPNVTGTLHMGHALVTTLQDILIRWKKMSGFETLWMPGTDHAGIATQTVVERHLLKTSGKHRLQFSREEFLQHVWEWKEKSQTTILGQIRAIGASCDWERLRFSMDEQCSKAVRHMFKKLFDHGLIYRGNYLVNWDPITGTALADDEVEYEDRQGSLWTIRYPIVGDTACIFVATTRPETMLGDTAVAVHPHDARYQHLIGKEVDQPITGRRIPIVADEFVDPKFGTGIVKITPAHDPCDYQLAQRRNLPMINILTKDGKINEEGGCFVGMTVLEARDAVVKELRSLGVLEKVEPHQNRVGVSYRSKATIEPMLSQQWFVRLSAFKETLIDYVVTKKVALIPPLWESTYFQWIDNLRDWCISRQLWWGHRIPVWYRIDNPEILICHEEEGEPEEVKKDPHLWAQDPDVLDTWFSSALWPLSTLGWPDNTPEIAKFYPTSTLITGHDIIFFWVARMIMMGHFALGKPPFHQTFLHGLIYGKSYWREEPNVGVVYVTPEEKKEYDLGKTPIPSDVKSRWEKMSKSKGNVIDPMEIIEEYGADAMRCALAAVTTDASIIELDRRRFEEFRHFINKIWNGARFVLTRLISEESPEASLTGDALYACALDTLPLEDRWIASRFSKATAKIIQSFDTYAFDKATTAVYEFFWNEFCAFYIEMSKGALSSSAPKALRTTKQALCLIILIDTIKLLHPFAPYITDELYVILKERFGMLDPEKCCSPRIRKALSSLKGEILCQTSYPAPQESDESQEAEEQFEQLQHVLQTLRAIRGEMKIAPSVASDLYVIGHPSSPTRTLIKDNERLLRSLVQIHTLTYAETMPSTIQLASRAPINDLELVVPLPAEMREQEKVRLQKAIEKLRTSSEKTQGQFDKLSVSGKAPAEVIEKLQISIVQQQRDRSVLEQQLEILNTEI
jgi:valyl-tRNA synthetase